MNETITTPAVTPTIRERVERGAAWLDTTVPAWRNSINVATLDTGDSNECVLGQVFWAEGRRPGIYNGFTYALGAFGDDGTPDANEIHWALSHGFEVDDESYDVLTAAWQRYLAEEA